MKHHFKEARLRQYAKHLEQNNFKCELIYSELSKNLEVVCKSEKEYAQILFFLPILEIPEVFKNDWYYDDKSMPVRKTNRDNSTISSIIEYFGINDSMFTHLFVVGQQNPELYGGKILSGIPKFNELASNINALIEQIRYYNTINENEFSILICLN
ncbi:MAG: hypothetical protein WBM13_11210 [Bacteroidia bacterium]